MMRHNLHPKINNGKVPMCISKGIYGLKEAGAQANQQLQRHLDPHGCIPSKCTPSLWNHDATKTMFDLVVDEFEVKCLRKINAEHLVKALKDNYEDVEVNWEGKKLCGINLKWDCTKRECQINVPGHVKKLQKIHDHPAPDKLQHLPSNCATKNAEKQQCVKENTILKKLSPEGIRKTQEIIGSWSFCCRATEHMASEVLSSEWSSQSKASEDTNKSINRCVDYLITFPNGTITHALSCMVLWARSDGACLVEDEANSMSGGHYFPVISSKTLKTPTKT